MKTLFALLAVVVVLLTGCGSSKNLTASRAKQLLREQFQAGERAGETIPYAPLATLGSIKTFTDYEPDRFVGEKAEGAAGSQVAEFVARGQTVIHNLLKAGLMKKTAVKDSLNYPNLTGDYTGRSPYASSSYSISMKEGSPVIDGTYKYDYCGGRISGSLDAEGTVTITVLSVGGFSPCSTTRSATYRIEHTGGGVELAYVNRSNVPHNANDKSANFYCNGSCGKGALTLTTYQYSFTPKFSKFVDVPGQKVKLGQVEFDSVDKL